MVLKVVIDTNFLTVPADSGIDIFSESEALLETRVRFIVLDSVVQEVTSNLSVSGRRRGDAKFRLAKDLLSRCVVEKVPESLVSMSVDEQLLAYTIETHSVLATNDRELRVRARSLGVPVLTLRGRKRVCLEGSIT